MPVNIYPNKKTKTQVEASRSFAGSATFEVEINEEMKSLTLQQIGRLLQKQLAGQGALGIRMVEIRASMIMDPNRIRSTI